MSIYDDIQDSLGVQLDRTAERKKQYLAQKSQEKKELLNPGYGEFNAAEWDVVDGDTVKNKLDPNRVLRFAGPNGHSMDTFETWKIDPKTGERYNPYDRDPSKAYYHRQAYAKQLGRDIGDISNEDLVNAGEAQAEHLRQNIGSLQGATFTEDGKGTFGRSIARFDNPEVFDVITKGVNAGYYAPSNALGYLEDFVKDEVPQHKERSLARALTGDALTSFGVGTARMASGLTQGVANFIGADSKVAINNFYSKLNKGIDNMNEYFSSEGKTTREAFDKKELELMSTMFDVRKRQYMEENPDAQEWQANLSAIVDEAADRIEYLIEEPGRILDASLESLPYMIGVGAVGRAASLKATQRLRGNFLREMKAGGLKTRARHPKGAKDAQGRSIGGRVLSDDAAVARFMASDDFIKPLEAIQRKTGITTVALTEGFSNSADVFNSVYNMTEEEAMQSEQYRALRKKGLTHEQANAKLAKEAFNQTLLTTTLIAGVASGVTGAAEFESRLFTRLGQRAKGKISTSNKLLRYGQQTGRAVGSFTGPGTREAFEETAQSGGGEFLSQLAKFEATGLGEVGPGVGTAAGEGGLVGFVSGAVAGGAGTTARGVFAAGSKVADVLSDKNNTHDEVPLTTPITDGEGNVGGTFKDGQEAVEQAGSGIELADKLEAELDGLQGNAEGAVLVKKLRVMTSAVFQDPTVPVERKRAILEKGKAAITRAGVEARAQAEAIIEKIDPKTIAESKEMMSIIKMAQDHGNLPKTALPPVIQSHFNASSKVAEAVEKAEQAAANTAETVEGKPQDVVLEEKMGEATTELGPGLRGHAMRIQETIENGDEEGYFNADQDLARFIATQAKKLQALDEMSDRIINKKEDPAEVVADINGRYKLPAELKWVTDPNVEAYNEQVRAKNEAEGTNIEYSLVGTTKLAADVRKELEAMGDVREALAEQAMVWNKQSPAIKKTAAVAKKEATPDLGTPFIPGVSAEGGNTKEPVGSRTEETVNQGSEATDSPTTKEGSKEATEETPVEPTTDERNPPTPTDDDIPHIPGVTDTGAASLGASAGRDEGTEDDGGEQRASEASEAAREPESEGSAPVRKKKTGGTVVEIDPDAPFKLNEGQEKAFDKAIAFLKDTTKKTFSIIGSAGTGKTTLINEVIDQVRKDRPDAQIVLSSPTHRANSVIQSKNPDKNVETLHKVLGLTGFVDLENFDAKKVKFNQSGEVEVLMPWKGILIVDESSMINDDLFQLLTETAEDYQTQIIFLGDMAQLGPVNQNTDSKALTGTDGQAELTQVMRAKNSELLDESTHVRTEGDFSNETDIDNDQNGVLFMNRPGEFIAKAVELFKSTEFKENPLLVRVVAYTNAAVSNLNTRIRKDLYGPNAPSLVEGEILMAYNMYGENIKNSLDYQVKSIGRKYKSSLFGVEVDVISVTLEDSISGTHSQVSILDPNTSAAKKDELTKAAFKTISDAKQKRYLWKYYYEQAEKFALPFALGNGNRTAVKRTFDYGYAHTIHKSQGGTYKYIMVASSNINKARSVKEKERLRYVAVTRAEKGAFILTTDKVIANDEGRTEANPIEAPAKDEQADLMQDPTPENEEEAVPFIPGGTSVSGPTPQVSEPFVPGTEDQQGAPQEPVEATEEKTPTETPPKKVLGGQTLENARRNVYELQRLVQDSALFKESSYVRLTSPKLTFHVRQLMDQGMTAGQAAEVLLTRYENAYESNIFEQESPNSISEEATDLLATTDEVAAGKKVKSSIMTNLEPAVDFLSDTMVKLLGLYVGKRKLPTSNWTEEELTATRDALKAKFRRVGLPSSIRRGLRLRNTETKNLLAAVPGVMRLLNNPTVKRMFAIRTKANAREEQAMNGVVEFVNSFIHTLQNDDTGISLGLLTALDHKNSPFRREKLGKDGIAITNRLHEYALQYFYDEHTGKLNEDLASIMAIEAGQWIATAGASTLNNRDDVINELIGRPKGTTIKDDDRKVFGNGTLMSNILSGIGQRVLSQANLSLNNKDVDPLFLDELHSSIGAMALSTLKMMDLVDIVPVRADVRNKLRAEDEAQEATNETLNLVHITTAGKYGSNEHYEESYENTQARLAFQGAQRILGDYFSTTSYVRGPLSKPSKAPSLVSRARTFIPMAQQKNMGKNSEFGWAPVSANIALLDQFEDEDFEREIMESEDPDDVQKNRREGVKSKAAQNKRSLAQVREWVGQNGSKTFYFAYHMIRSGRIYIDSNTINPQSDKLHRFMFAMRDWKVTMDTKYPNPTGRTHENFLIAVALGLDVDTDGQYREQILEEINKKLTETEIDGAPNRIPEVIALLQQDIKYSSEQAKLIASVLPAGEREHGLAALKAYADYTLALEVPGRDSIDIYLPMETDGKTNGFSANMLQLPPSSPGELAMVKQMLRATGVFFKDDEFENYPGFAQDEKNFDNYQQVANGTASIVDKMRQGHNFELDEPGNPRWEAFLKSIRSNKQAVAMIEKAGFIVPDRSFAKTPLMVVAYGAGYFSIRNSILDKAEAKLYEDLQKVTTVKEAAIILTRLQMVTDATTKQTKQSYKEAYKEHYNDLSQQEDIRKWALEFTMHPAQQENFRNGLDAVYGHALQRALEDKLGPMKKIRSRLNEAVYLMNLMFTKNFVRMVEQQERILGRSLADRERVLIVNKMIKQGLVPLIKTPLSESQLDSLEVTSSGKIIIGKDKGTPRKGRAYFRRPLKIRGKGFVLDRQGKPIDVAPPATDSLIGSLQGYMPNMDIGVGALVKMIHSSDGAVNGEVMGRHPILNVHDAQVGNFNKIDDIAADANKTFYETHRDWGLAQETMESLQDLLPLLDEGDPRLTPELKAEVHEEFKEYLLIYSQEGSNLDKFEGKDLTDKWLKSLQSMVNKTNEARETLFSQIKSVNQFAKEGHKDHQVEYTVPSQDPGAVNPRSMSMINAVSSVKEMLSVLRDQKANAWSKKKREMVIALTQPDADIQTLLNDWMAPTGIGHAPAAEDMLDVLYEAIRGDFINEKHRDHLRDLISVLRPMLRLKDAKTGKYRRIYVRLGGAVEMGTSEGRFDADAGHILINENAKDTVSAILHEIIHAANVKQLEVLQEEGSDTFQELLKEAKDWMRASRTAKEGSPTWAVREAIKEELRNDKKNGYLRLVTEYVAYLNATLSVNQEGGRRFIFTSDKFNAVNALARSLETKSGTNTFYSSAENTTEALFEKVQGKKLTAGTAAQLMEMVKRFEKTPVSQDMQNLFDRLMKDYVLPGLVDIDEIILKIASNPDGSRNIGKWITNPRKSEIQVEAASQNYFTSPVDMSLQEVYIHEILHAIFETALTDPAISKEAERLISLVQAELTKEHGAGNEWMAFKPTEPGTDPDLDERLAKERYRHIFENGEASLQEFMSIGLSNPQFLEILQNVDDKSEGNIFEGGLVQTLFNMLEKALEFIRERMLNQPARTVDKSLENLAQRIIRINAQTMANSKKAADEGYLTRKLETLNDAALRKMATMLTPKLQKWAEANSLSGAELHAAAKNKNKAAQLFLAARTATASTLDENALKEFREAFESAITGIKKDHWLYQMLTEILPWADRNRGWIDALRDSEKLIDMVRQQKFEHTRTALKSYFDPKAMKKMSRTMRENITRILLDTDVVALMSGDNPMQAGDLLNLLKSPRAVADLIEALTQDLESRLTDDQFRLFDYQSKGLANLMVTGRAGAIQAMNVDVILQQLHLNKNARTKVKGAKEVRDTLDKLTSLRAFQAVQQRNTAAVTDVMNLMTAEMNRPVRLNGFNGVMGTANTFKQLSQEMLFEGNPLHMQKGYTSDITDPEIEIKAVMDTPQDRMAMREQGYTEIKKALPRADIDDGPPMVLYKKKKGIARFSKSVVSLTGMQKQGHGMFDSAFAIAPDNVPRRVTAAQTHNKIKGMTTDTENMAERIMRGQPVVDDGVQVVPLFDGKGEMMDFRYVMDHNTKREHLKKRDMFDEVLPRMMASIEDKLNTKKVNHNAIDLLHAEFIAARKQRALGNEDQRFVMVGPNVQSKQGQELWNLLPKDTKEYAEEVFGAPVLYMRDDAVNLVLGFRKIAWSDNKILAPHAPVVDAAEKVWLEVMQWVRYRIAVLTPQVVIGNMISNWALLLSQGIPANYIIRQSKMAIIGMRKYQKDVRARNELDLAVANLKAQGKRTTVEEQKLIRLNHAIRTNPVASLVEEGMFTSIVEEFGTDEDSTRRQATTKFLDKFGGITGAHGVVKVAQEAWMVPGSETGQLALMATQYGDFIGRFIQYNWQTKVKKIDKRQAIHDALDTFIYYNVPQNRILQFMNDNGFLMFTKFFFRIQHITGRVFKKNPVHAGITLGVQSLAGGATGSRTAEENIANYAFLNNLGNKFQSPWDHIAEGDMLIPTFLKWIPDAFFGN